MIEKRELICIGCPMGCHLEVELEGKEVLKVTGNTCKRGEEYGKKECTSPTRIVTSSVEVEQGENDIVPVKTERDIPKELVFECIKKIKEIKVKAPVYSGQVIVENIFDTGVNVIATKSVLKKN